MIPRCFTTPSNYTFCFHFIYLLFPSTNLTINNLLCSGNIYSRLNKPSHLTLPSCWTQSQKALLHKSTELLRNRQEGGLLSHVRQHKTNSVSQTENISRTSWSHSILLRTQSNWTSSLGPRRQTKKWWKFKSKTSHICLQLFLDTNLDQRSPLFLALQISLSISFYELWALQTKRDFYLLIMCNFHSF